MGVGGRQYSVLPLLLLVGEHVKSIDLEVWLLLFLGAREVARVQGFSAIWWRCRILFVQ